MKDCVTFEGQYGEENLFLQNIDGYFACQNPDDAKLIAAAPDLLEALQDLVTELGDDWNMLHNYLDRARAAIVKATE